MQVEGDVAQHVPVYHNAREGIIESMPGETQLEDLFHDQQVSSLSLLVGARRKSDGFRA